MTKTLVPAINIKIVMVLLSLALPLLVSSAYAATPRVDGGIAEIIERGVLRVGLYYKDKPPFVMTREDGTLHGLDIDLARAIAKELGVKVHFDRTSKNYTEMVDRVSAGVDFDLVICKMSATMKRAVKVRFSSPYLMLYQALALNKKFLARHKISAHYPISDLKSMNFTVGIRESTSYIEYAKKLFPSATIVEGKWSDLLQKLKSGEINGLMRDSYTFSHLLHDTPTLALDINVYTLSDLRDPICIAVPHHNSMLQYWLNLYLNNRYPEPLTTEYLIKEFSGLWNGEKEVSQ